MYEYEVIIIGGGPAGSTAGALLARVGIKTLIIEKEKFPRYHVGESLLASCKRILEISGAFEKVARHGFQVKHGARVKWGDDDFNLDWVNNVNAETWSWQVERGEYDHILLKHARDCGAEIREGCTAQNVMFNAISGGKLFWSEHNGSGRLTGGCFKYIIDASGRRGFLAKRLRTREPNIVMKNSAMWSYWTNAVIPGGFPLGALQVLSTPDGWWWVIPLQKNVFSVGFVTSKRNFIAEKARYRDLLTFYTEKLKSCSDAKMILSNAVRTSGVLAENDYSYVSRQFCDCGYLLAGDAACFLDPLLATGVHLAQFSALLAVATVKSILREEISERQGLDFYELIYRRSYQRLLAMVSHLYCTYPGKDSYFWATQRLTKQNLQKSPLQIFLEISSGMADMMDAQDFCVRLGNEELLYESRKVNAACKEKSIFKNSALINVDLSPIWDPWRNIVGKCTKTDQVELVIAPEIGLKYLSNSVR